MTATHHRSHHEAGDEPHDGTGPATSAFGSVAAALWPAPAQLRPGRPGSTAEPSYLALPNATHPRLLLPRRPRRVAATAVRRYNSFGSRRARFVRELVAVGVRCGLTDVAASRVLTVSGSAAGIEGFLSERLGAEVLLAIFLGPARANRKPVLQLLLPDGTTLGYAKVGIDPLTGALVRAEAAALARLADAGLHRLDAPRLLLHDRWNGSEVLVQSALPVWESRTDVVPAQVAAAAREISTIDREDAVELTAHAYWRALQARVSALPATRAADALRAALAELGSQAAGIEVSVSAWHGDWSPWNMAVSRGRLCVWDWERFSGPVPTGFDMLHYSLQSALVVDRLAGSAAADRVLERAGPAPAERAVALCYLIHLAARYLRDGQAEAGATHGKVQQWLVPAVQRHVVTGGCEGHAAAEG